MAGMMIDIPMLLHLDGKSKSTIAIPEIRTENTTEIIVINSVVLTCPSDMIHARVSILHSFLFLTANRHILRWLDAMITYSA